ncbi:MAG: tRNA 2-thiocytidine(32) synthetase TtcA, partial [Bacteroidales bacterium]|nr:tRNA 2-thiocytidine(32) synthetase TtcA [Bacteroidales bacterium]
MGKFTPQQRLRYRLDRQMRKAIRDYKMIDQGDALLIGLSGGKDSLALVELLGDMSRVLVPRFKVYALHVQMTNIPYQADVDFLRRHCEAHGVEFLLRERSFDA